MRRSGTLVLAAMLCVARVTRADEANERAPRKPDASWGEVVHGPFVSPRLFQMPVAHTVGAYVMSLSYDGSLLQEQGVLSSAGVFALGVGDIAQLEYRHTSAISFEQTSAPLPAVGVQIAAPLPDHPPWPQLAGAFRLGIPRNERSAGLDIDETVTDIYVVTAWQLPGSARTVTLHGGVRVSRAVIEISGVAGEPIDHELVERLVLPSAGAEWQVTEAARIVAEVGQVPRFVFDPERPSEPPEIATAVQGRLGVRWQLIPAMSIDASLGYQAEAASVSGESGGGDAVVDWDIRLGGELFVPWGAIACRSIQVFCE